MKYEERYLPDGKFDLEGMVTKGRLHVVGEILLVLLFGAFFAYGGYNFYYVIKSVQDFLATFPSAVLDVVLNPIIELFKSFSWQVIIVLAVSYFLTLQVSYLVVRFFGKLAGVFLYGSTIVQIALFLWLFYFFGTWEYHWIFLIPVALQACVLIFWRKKLNLAIQYVKLSSLIVWKKRRLIIPQLLQTLWIIILSLFYFVTIVAVFFNITEVSGTFTIGTKTVEITQGWIFAGYTALFVFLIYVVYFVVLGIKIDLIHSYVRSKGTEMSFSHAWSVTRRRWWGLMGYAFASTIIHLIQFFYKLFKKQIKPESILDAAKLTKEVIPAAPMSADKKGGKFKKPPLRERIWMGLNYFTLPALTLEDRLFFSACFRSLKLIGHNIPDLYIKHANVDRLFKVMKISSVFLNGILGGAIGALFGRLLGLTGVWTYAALGVGVGLFVWMGGITSVLVLNDLNLSYITLMFMHTIDDLNGKKDYIDFKLKPKEEVEANFIAKEQKKADKKHKEEPEVPTRMESEQGTPLHK
ncbi:MAG: hypothetical protein RBG13Loki_0805 [Promethearchaeota archaeon CR_4]|nr:MAG: hypothetical protein RBG13Loki_0805 [Candidatus Lokiarchaeota archaeon CR_4]